MDRARDELMSHVMRCGVLDAAMDARNAWLDDTLQYMAERYPDLTPLQLAQLDNVGRQFIKPAIPHGKGNTAFNRPEATVLTADGENVPESEARAPDPNEAGADVAPAELQLA